VGFVVLEKRLVSEEHARALLESRGDAEFKWLIATTSLAPRTRTLLRDAEMSWVERESGRCRLYGPGLLVDVVAGSESDELGGTQPRERTAKPPSRLRDKSGLIAEALLQRDQSDPVSLGELAETTGISRGLVSRLFARLTDLEILETHGQPPRRYWTLNDAGALLDRWAAEERAIPDEVTGLSVWSRTPDHLLDRLVALGATQFPCSLGGVAAANLYAPTLSVTPQADVWIPADIPAAEMAKALGGEVVQSGANVRVLQTAGDTAFRLSQTLPAAYVRGRDLTVVSPYRAYVEARKSVGRGPDAADALRQVLRLTRISASELRRG
jgi:DNA-binding transcriptional ArsR family regulator